MSYRNKYSSAGDNISITDTRSDVNMDDETTITHEAYSETGPSICQDCMQIDLSPGFAISTPPLQDLRKWNISSGVIIAELQHFSLDCELCHEFRSVRRHEDKDCIYDLRAFPFSPAPYEEHRFDDTGDISAIVLPDDVLWLQPVPQEEASRNSKSLDDLACLAIEHGWVACVVTTNSPTLFRPQTVSLRFNDTLVKAWLNSCEIYHGAPCDTLTTVPHLTLIDCLTRKLCQPSTQPPYVALSYVWGKMAARGHELAYSRRDVLSDLPAEAMLSQVIKDSISVTVKLGFRYLWIDKFCIEQSDATRQHGQIQTMDMVYKGADLTIIAAAGEDEQHGLPGIGIKRDASLSLEIQAFTIMHMSPAFDHMWMNSRWSSRAWTLQEETFSRRRLYFFPETFAFVCKKMHCSEAHGGAELAQYVTNMKAYSDGWFKGSLQKLFMFEERVESEDKDAHGTKCLERMRAFIWNYTRRSMTYRSDALRAFAGIRRVFQAEDPPVCMIQGVPAILTVTSGTIPVLAKFVSSLCWYSLHPLQSRREPEFPSWTWLGWSGGANFDYALDTDHDFELNPQFVSFMYEDDHQITLQELARILHGQHRQELNDHNGHELSQGLDCSAKDWLSPVILKLRAPMLPASLFSYNSHEDWKSVSLANMTFDPDEASELPFNPLFLQNGIAVGTLGCALLRVDRLWGDPRAHWLLIQWQGSNDAVRIGKVTTVRKSKGDFEVNDLLGVLEWRDIRLM